ncbi:MAG: hypothetical protein R2749_12655 [Acidimicrobiales bacterium]
MHAQGHRASAASTVAPPAAGACPTIPARTGPRSPPPGACCPLARLARDGRALSERAIGELEALADRLGEVGGPAEPPPTCTATCGPATGWWTAPAAAG